MSSLLYVIMVVVPTMTSVSAQPYPPDIVAGLYAGVSDGENVPFIMGALPDVCSPTPTCQQYKLLYCESSNTMLGRVELSFTTTGVAVEDLPGGGPPRRNTSRSDAEPEISWASNDDELAGTVIHNEMNFQPGRPVRFESLSGNIVGSLQDPATLDFTYVRLGLVVTAEISERYPYEDVSFGPTESQSGCSRLQDTLRNVTFQIQLMVYYTINGQRTKSIDHPDLLDKYYLDTVGIAFNLNYLQTIDSLSLSTGILAQPNILAVKQDDRRKLCVHSCGTVVGNETMYNSSVFTLNGDNFGTFNAWAYDNRQGALKRLRA